MLRRLMFPNSVTERRGTNCILTRTGAVTALITTTGFRDVLEIRRMRMHKLYDIFWEKPKPMVPRHLRMEIDARTDPKNGTESSLDEDEIEAIIDKLDAEGVQSVAICYLHSYASGANERRTRDILLNRHPSWFISISSEVLPEIKEYERTSTTVINAYVQPPVARYAKCNSIRHAGSWCVCTHYNDAIEWRHAAD